MDTASPLVATSVAVDDTVNGSAASELAFGPGDAAALLAGPAHAPVHALALQGLVGALGPLVLLDAAEPWLAPGPARLMLDDRFTLRRAPAPEVQPPLLDSLLALAARCGWLLSGPVHQQAESDGLHARCRLVLQRDETPPARLHATGLADAEPMRRLFADIFGHAMPEAHWQWKYGGGRGRGVAITREGRMLAHYGGTTRQVLWQGRPAQACQVCDVMVAPEANRALVRKGPMHQVSATFLEEHLGWGGSHALAYGFPSDRHHVLAERLGLYIGVDSIHRASWPAAAQPIDGCTEALGEADLRPGGRRVAAVARLWQAMAGALREQIVGVRDAGWLRYRYLQRPGLSYQLLYLRRRWTRRPVGVVVLRLHERHAEVLDLVADPADFGALIALARSQAAQAGLERLDCWITQSQLHRLSGIDTAACSTMPVGITVPANVHTPGPVDEVRGRWFLLAGDADFT